MARERSNRLEIGRIGAPFGVRGELHATLHFAGSDALTAGQPVMLARDSERRELVLRSVRPHGRGIVLGFEGVDDRDAALALRGARIEVERARLPPLEPGEYYLVDLVGARVVGPDGPVGEVIEVVAHPSVLSVTLQLVDGRKAEQPLSEPWVAHVDAEAGRIELSSLDGLVV